MSQEVLDIVQQQAAEALMKLDAQGVVTAEHVADSVLRQAAYWEKPLEAWLQPVDPETAARACRKLGLKVRMARVKRRKAE